MTTTTKTKRSAIQRAMAVVRDAGVALLVAKMGRNERDIAYASAVLDAACREYNTLTNRTQVQDYAGSPLRDTLR